MEPRRRPSRAIRRGSAGSVLLALLAACSPPLAPGTDPDVDKYPYVRSPNGVRIFGTSRILVILAPFADGLPEPYSPEALKARLFGSRDAGPVPQTFRLASGNRFTLRADFTPWLRSPLTAQQISQPGGLGAYVMAAILAAAERLDLGVYDNDGPDGVPNSGDDDGLVDGGVVILNSELNAFCPGRGPHPVAVTRWRPSNNEPFPTPDPRHGGGVISVGAYTVMSATGCSATENSTPTLAHELGHVLFALPDLYQHAQQAGPVWDTRRWILGCWDLMASGSGWGCGSGPPVFDGRIGALGAWTRTQIGWAAPDTIPVDVAATYDLFPLGRGGTVLHLPIKNGEYLLLEYREPVAPGDAAPPAAGVLVYHITEPLPLFPLNAQGRSRVNLLEADDDDGLLRSGIDGGNRGVADDAFGTLRTSLLAGSHSRFTAADGTPLPFELPSIIRDVAQHRARVRVVPFVP